MAECINRAGKNSNTITLVTIIIMLPQLYRGILRTLVESEQFIQTFFGIFRDIQQHSAMFRHIEGYSGIIEAYEAIFKHIREFV